MRLPSTTAVGPTASASPGPAVPLSLGEEQMVFLQGLVPDGRPLDLVGAITLTGAVDEASLARAWAAVVGRFPALRSTLTAAAEPVPPLAVADRAAARDEGPTGEPV